MPLVISSALAVGLGGLVLWWARAAARGTLRRQWLLGYRTPLTLTDERAWVIVNRAVAPYLGVAGIALVAGGVVAAVLSITAASTVAPAVLAGAVVVAFVVLLLSFVPAARTARRYKRSRGGRQR